MLRDRQAYLVQEGRRCNMRSNGRHDLACCWRSARRRARAATRAAGPSPIRRQTSPRCRRMRRATPRPRRRRATARARRRRLSWRRASINRACRTSTACRSGRGAYAPGAHRRRRRRLSAEGTTGCFQAGQDVRPKHDKVLEVDPFGALRAPKTVKGNGRKSRLMPAVSHVSGPKASTRDDLAEVRALFAYHPSTMVSPFGRGSSRSPANCRPAAGCPRRAALSSSMMRIAVGVALLASAMLGCGGDTGPGGRVGRPAARTTAKSAASQVCGPSPDASIGGCGASRAYLLCVDPTGAGLGCPAEDPRRRSARTAGPRSTVALGLATTSAARRNTYCPAEGVDRTPRRGIPPPRAAL